MEYPVDKVLNLIFKDELWNRDGIHIINAVN